MCGIAQHREAVLVAQHHPGVVGRYVLHAVGAHLCVVTVGGLLDLGIGEIEALGRLGHRRILRSRPEINQPINYLDAQLWCHVRVHLPNRPIRERR